MMAAEPVDAARAPRPGALLVHPRSAALCQVLLACFFAYWVSLLLVWPQAMPRDADALRPLVIAAMAIMWRVTSVYLGGLLHARQVLSGRQTPGALWLQLSRVAAWRIGVVWALLCAAMPVAFLWTGAGMQPMYGAALISLTALVAAAGKLARTDGAQPKLSLLLCIVWLAWMVWLALDAARFTRVGAATPAAALLACTLASPLALMFTLRRALLGAGALPTCRGYAAAPHSPLLRRAERQIRRFTMVAWRQRPPVDADAPPVPQIAKALLVISANLYPLWALLQIARPVWHQGRVDLIRLSLLVACGFVMVGALVARDVGWRSFLMPGGLQRGHIAGHIWRWTMACQFTILAAMALVFAAVAHFGLQRSWDSVGASLLGLGLLLFELMFVCSLGVLLRGLPYSVKLLPGLAGMVLGVVVVVFAMTRWPVLSVALPLGWYAGALCVASGLLLAVANRIWQPARLFHDR